MQLETKTFNEQALDTSCMAAAQARPPDAISGMVFNLLTLSTSSEENISILHLAEITFLKPTKGKQFKNQRY